MRVLGIDSSGIVASVAIVEDEELLAEYTVNYKKTHSQTLLPMLDEIVKMLEFDMETIDAIAVAGGPGSFTGLRIGSATAKGLGLALNKELIHVPTVDALAYNLVGHDGLVCPIMDARREQTYTGIYSFEGNQIKVLKEQCAVGIDEIVEELNRLGQKVTFLGDGVKVFREYISNNLKAPFDFAPANNNKQRAASVAALGLELYAQGTKESAAMHRPDYLRLSQAERELLDSRDAK